ncbi:MAG: MCE family protein [Rhodospirillales bacterium]|nr:MCE family protein [Rhodospirillales bacterium]
MNGSKINYVVVGAFVVAVLAGLIVSLVWLKGWTSNTIAYIAIFRNVSGLTAGTNVLYEGFPVGQVTALNRLDREDTSALFGESETDGPVRFRVEFEVKSDWSLPANCEAHIVANGLLAASVISIIETEGATEDTPRELDGVRVIASQDSQTLWRKAETLVDTVAPLTAVLEEILRGSVKPTFDELKQLAVFMQGELPPIVDQIKTFTTTLGDTAEEVKKLTSTENRQYIEQMLGNMNVASSGLVSLTNKLDGLATSLDALVGSNRADVDRSIDSLRYVLDAIARDIDSINRNIEGTARNMNEFSRQIRQNPGLLLGGSTPPDAARHRDRTR